MPNHVKNILKAPGLTKLPVFAENEDGNKIFDFNKLIEMPEELRVVEGSQKHDAIRAVIRKIAKSGEEPLLSGPFTKSGFEKETEYLERKAVNLSELEELGLTYIKNIVQYGYATWYEWALNNWDTKWNSYDFEEIDEDTVKFCTVWNAPEKVIQLLAERYPMLEIEHWWADEDAGNNTGYKKYHQGNVDGGYISSGSNEAFENYFKCWGESLCFEKIDGQWHRKDCDECQQC